LDESNEQNLVIPHKLTANEEPLCHPET